MKKIFLLVVLFLLFDKCFGQTISGIDSLVSRIENDHFFDTIVVDIENNTIYESLTGFVSKDSLMKIEVKYKDTASLTIYSEKNHSSHFQYFYARECRGQKIKEYYFFEDTIVCDSKIYLIWENDSMRELDDLLSYISYCIEREIIDKKAAHYTFVGKLHEIPQDISSCGGIIPSGAAFKYEVIETDFEFYKCKYVIIKTACPPLYGKGYFVAGEKYRLRVATNNGASFNIKIVNDYSKENIPEFWLRQIERIE